MKKENTYITGLRGILSITVLMWHFGYLLENYKYVVISPRSIFRGDIANVGFFVLSGFLTGINEDKYKKPQSVFYRIKKVYPFWISSTLVAAIPSIFLVNEVGINLNINKPLLCRLIYHLMLIQSWIPNIDASEEFNGPGWFLSALLLCWVITPVVLQIKKKFRNTISIKRQLLMIVIMYILYYYLWNLSEYKVTVGVYQPWVLLSYIYGIIIAGSHKEGQRGLLGWFDSRFQSLLVYCGVVLLIVLSNIKFNNPITYFTSMVIMGEIILALALTTDKYDSLFSWEKIINFKAFTILGGASLYLYLIHIPIYRIYWWILDLMHFEKKCLFSFCFLSIVSVTFALMAKWLNIKVKKSCQE